MSSEINKNLIVIDKFLGMNSLHEATTIPDFYLANSVNCSCASIGSISPFKQYSEFANQLTTTGKIPASNTVYCSDSSLYQAKIPLRIRDDTSTGTLEWYNKRANKWETLKGSYTTGKTMIFADFNNATTDRVYYCNGTDKYTHWDKVIGTIASNTATIITLNETASTQGFSSGTVIINGTEYSYTGVSGKTLTGLSGLPTFDTNEGVAHVVDESDDAVDRRFDIMWVADGRIWGAKTTSPRLLYSETGDGTSWTAGSIPSSPGFKDFIEGQGSITALASIQENIIVFKEDLVILYKHNYPTATTRTEQVKELKRGHSVGAINQQGLIKIGDTIIYTTPSGGIKSIAFSKIQEGFDFEDLTENIRPSLEDGVFTSAQAIWFEKKRRLIVSFKKDSDSTANDRQIVIEYTKSVEGYLFKALGTMDWFVGSWFIYDDDLYFGGSFEPNCFKAFDGYQKGKAGIPYIPLFTIKRYRFSRNPLQQKEILYIPIIGWIGAGTTIKFQLDLDFLGSRAHLESELSASETAYIIEPEFNTIGAFELGNSPIGGVMESPEELNYFKIYFTIPQKYHPFDIQLSAYSDTAGARWKLETINFDIRDADFEVDSHLKKQFS